MSGSVKEPLRADTPGFATQSGRDDYTERRVNDMPVAQTNPEKAADTVTMGRSGGDEPELDISAGQKMLSAVSGSLLTSLLVTPLDVVRVRLQSQPNTSSLPRPTSGSIPSFSNLPPNLGVTACCREVFWVNNTSSVCLAAGPTLTTSVDSIAPSTSVTAADCAVDETRRKTYTSTLDGLRKIARNEGLPSLWRGLSPTLVMAIPANVIYFTGYDVLRSHKRSPVNQYINDGYAPLVAGSVARVSAAAVISPIEMFRTRMQAAPAGASGVGVFKETLLGLRKLVLAQGYASLWRGLTLTMWRDVPFSGLYWWGYEAGRNRLRDLRYHYPTTAVDHQNQTHLSSSSHPSRTNNENHSATFIDSFLAGATSGAVAAIVTTPFDVGKTRQQVLTDDYQQKRPAERGASSASSSLRPEERSMPRFLYHIWREEGAAGLFRGWAARCLKVAPACAIMISSYEIGKKMARTMNERKASQR
ncbi:Carrier protein, mitochondrial [Xanthoria calcicola]